MRLCKKLVLCCAAACLLGGAAGAEAASSTDSYFEGAADEHVENQGAVPDPANISSQKPLSITASFTTTGGFISGYKTWDKTAMGFDGLNLSGGVIISSDLSFKARFNPTFSFQGGVTLVYPNTTEALSNPKGDLITLPTNTPIAASAGIFAVVLDDVFADYALGNVIFAKVGRFGQTWGNSYFFKSSDIINRALPNTLSDGLRMKLGIPLGPVNLSVMGQAFSSYFADINNLNAKNLGYAAHVDFPVGPVEIGLGGFYQESLTPRVMTSFKSSISPFDVFADFTVAFDYNREKYPSATNRAYFCTSVGIWGKVDELYSQFYVEYLYNGERDYVAANKSWTNNIADAYQPGGHNLSLLWRFTPDNWVVKPLAQLAFNFTDGSGVVIPGLVINISDNLKLQLGLPIYFDSNFNANRTGEAGYLASSITQGYTCGLVVRLTLNGSVSME